MSHRDKLEQVLELLINEEQDAAAELLHSVIVEKARGMYEELVDEDFGGDEKEDFADEIESDKEEIESDEIFDDEEGEGDEGEEDSDEPAEEEEVEDRLEDVEASLAELRAEFDALMADELDEPEHADLDVEMDGELDGDIEMEEKMYEEECDEELEEATKLQDEQNVDMGSEGKLAGTGNKSKVGATGKESMFTKAPSKADHGGKPHETGVGGDESGMKAGQGEDHTPEDNIDVPQKKQSAKTEVKDDKGAKSTLGSKGAPTGA